MPEGMRCSMEIAQETDEVDSQMATLCYCLGHRTAKPL